MQYLNFNGNLLNEGTAMLSADSRGLRYGDGLFETMKMRAGQIIFCDAHFERLWKGLHVLGFDVTASFTEGMLHEQVRTLCKQNAVENAARIRITILRGNGSVFSGTDQRPNYIIQCWPLAEETGNWNTRGLRLGVYDAARKSCDILSNLKHNNYLPYVLAAMHAGKMGWDDAILLNSHARICDTTIANIFLVQGQVVHTPALGEGCVAGTIRKMLLKVLPDFDFKIVEGKVSITQLLSADEVFVTNSIYNIRWVHRVDEKEYTNVITQKIFEAFLPTIY